MATTAREEEEQKPYEGGGYGGAGGKFRKRPFRRSNHTKPYDRPPTAFRNPNNNGGWLSKLVDPAHRLITSSAHRLFSTVFRKRLTPPQPPSPEANYEARNKQQEAVAKDFPGTQHGAIDQSDGPSNSSRGGELTELEQISEIDRLTALLHSRTVDLAIEDQEKRSEVVPFKPVASADRQEGLRKTSSPGVILESEGLPKTPAPENRMKSQHVSTPVVSSTVLEGDITSPTEVVELAKSYMHKKPTSPSMLGIRSQAIKENSAAIYTRNLTSPSNLPITPLVSRTAGHVNARENGFITPRSRGRSAIYSMARTPYSRVHPANSLKGVENAVEVYAGPSSSSQYAQDQNLLSRSKPGAFKRRSSVLDNDIGSYGAIRRIRQKPNLLSSRGLSLPISGSPFSSSGNGLGSESAQNPSSSVLKPSFGEPKHNFIEPSTENGENIVPNTTVPSKSSEMASKILQQLDKLVSPKDKSSQPKVLSSMDTSRCKLSPSMLCGQALKSLEDVDSSKFLGEVQNNKLLDGSLSKRMTDALEFTSQGQDNVKENGPLKLNSAYGKSTLKMNGRDCTIPEANGEDSTVSRKDAVPSIVTSVPAAYSPHKKRAFRMSAHEDFVDLDDDSHSNGAISDSFSEGKEKVKSSLAERKISGTEDVKLDKASAFTEIKPVATEMNQNTDMGTHAENSTNLVFQNTSSPSVTVLPTVFNTESSLTSNSAILLKESNVSPPIFNFGDKIPSTRDADAASPIFNLGVKTSDKVPQSQFIFSSSSVSEHGNAEFNASLSKPATSSNLSTAAAGAIDSVPKFPEPDKADSEKNSKVTSRTPGTTLPSAVSTSSANIFSFSTTSDVSLNNGSSASTSSTPLVFNNMTSQNSSNGLLFASSGSNISTASSLTLANSSSSLSTSTPAPSLPAAPVFNFGSSMASAEVAPVLQTSSVPTASVFKFGTCTDSTAVAPASETSSVPVLPVFEFGSTVPTAVTPVLETSSVPAITVFKFSTPTTVPPVSETSDVACETIKTKLDTGVGNLSSSPFSGTSAAITSTVSTLFGFSAAAAATSSTVATQSEGPFGVGNASVPSSQASPTGTVLATFTQSIPLQFGSSGSSPTFGLSGSTTLSSGSSSFGSTTAAEPFSSGTTLGLGSSSLSEANLVSSSSSSTASLSGSTWQPPKSPAFAFNSTPSSGFSFAATTSASTTTNSSPAIFGASTPSASTNGAPMIFGSSNGASSSSPFLFNSSSGPASTQPVFGSTSPFAFGASSVNNDQMEDSMAEDTVQASATMAPGFGQPTISPFVFGSGPPSVSNPFQFGGQPNLANPQNPSPFQASGSLGQGSNFSLGSGGSGVDKSNRKYVKVKHKQRKK
ncbi:hypothetical protein PanWU01x14_010580 [Parasponia andersonii]|uniref:Uncharacterized protein n=1 Tax=Parasponia andersonii TaxID=3476 RepID=A0A2P5E2P9_PARAD|nr:hypothetical protein PanWU01x14_010580 [Parasponia andersonii]